MELVDFVETEPVVHALDPNQIRSDHKTLLGDKPDLLTLLVLTVVRGKEYCLFIHLLGGSQNKCAQIPLDQVEVLSALQQTVGCVERGHVLSPQVPLILVVGNLGFVADPKTRLKVHCT